uniref:thioredoxin-dependent peroxiredoxin n=1 Tax=Eucampia antarctica TaxID=49252 RepID=A0A7S2WH90_9STRA|mmetsp:Transcript_30536/g.29438  ORF Transcript_30536/g.29438 Transcript_30536/m.29438 type:complete len:224 (+) Transcript_30536:146-817(+)
MGKEQDAYDKKNAEMQEQYMAFVTEKATEEDMTVMGKCGAKLKELMPNPGLKVGYTAPDFTLPDSSGTKITLSEELKKGPVVLVFYRGAWCPVCNMHLNALQDIVPVLKSKYNASIIALTPQMLEVSKNQLEGTTISYKVCSDLDDSISKSYNLYYDLDPELDDVYMKMGINVKATNGGDRLGVPVPGTFIIDKKGIVKAMQADTDYMKRMKPDEIFSGLEQN